MSVPLLDLGAQHRLGGRPGDLPVSEQAAGEVLSIPVYPELTGAQREEVLRATKDAGVDTEGME